MYGWNDRSTKAELKHFNGGDDYAAVFKIGEYLVTVPCKEGENPAVIYRSEYRHTSDPRATLPNMEVRDGQIRIELTDLVGVVLSRLEPLELAQTLWQDEAVRSEFMQCLVSRYNSDHISDKERRAFLVGVKEAVHDKSIDALASIMAKLEYEVSRAAHYYDEIHRINVTLRELNVTVQRARFKDGSPDGVEDVVLQFDARDHGAAGQRGELEIGGKAWEEAREFWRDEVRKQFPTPKSGS